MSSAAMVVSLLLGALGHKGSSGRRRDRTMQTEARCARNRAPLRARVWHRLILFVGERRLLHAHGLTLRPRIAHVRRAANSVITCHNH